MELCLKKRLTISEKKRHYVNIPSKNIALFPKPEVEFIVIINNKKIKTYIDQYKRLRLGSRIFNELFLDSPDSVIIIEKDSKGNYVIKKSKNSVWKFIIF